MLTTYRSLITFRNLAIQYVNAANDENKPETILTAALHDAIDDTEPKVAEYNKQTGRLKRRFAETDKKTSVLLKDEHGRYQYTEKGENDLEDAIDELLDTEIHIKIEHAAAIPPDLHRVFLKGFKGFVIEPDYQPNQEAE